MEAPPAYAAPKKKMSTCLIVVIIFAILGLCCCGGAGVLGYLGFNKGKDFAACGQAFDDLQKAFDQYQEAHDGKLPKAAKWMDDVRPYYQKLLAEKQQKTNIIPWMPAEGNYHCVTDGKETGIAYNKDLSGKAVKSVKDPEDTILIFETPTPGPNISEPYKPLDKETSPKLMNEHRGWFTAPIVGIVSSGKMKYRSGVNGAIKVDTTPEPETDKK